jgi:hypothetical protein
MTTILLTKTRADFSIQNGTCLSKMINITINNGV